MDKCFMKFSCYKEKKKKMAQIYRNSIRLKYNMLSKNSLKKLHSQVLIVLYIYFQIIYF